MPAIIYLGGDSYPTEFDIEMRITQKMEEALGIPVIGQHSMLHSGQGVAQCSLEERLERLDSVAGLFEGPIFLMGRSSGARIATYFARHWCPVAGVICFAYPFCPPGQLSAPERVAHLADSQSPTLMFQGYEDCYGGQHMVAQLSLSKAIQVEFLQASHEFELSPEAFEAVFQKTQAFIRGLISQA